MKRLLKVAGLMTAALLALPAAGRAQTVTFFGSLSNFDALNDSGQDAHGFEIELQGVDPANVTYTWGGTYSRYGAGRVVPFPAGGGVWVRWMSAYDPLTQAWAATTMLAPHTIATNGHQCIQGVLPGYDTSGCEHFGMGLNKQATTTVYRWLVASPTEPGSLVPSGTPVAIPAPTWLVIPPALPADPPVVQAAFVAPVPRPPAKLFGDAQWVKTYKTEVNREVNLDELLPGNAVVPQDPAQIEVEWDIVQDELVVAGNRRRRGQKLNEAPLGAGARAVVRRYEIFKYTGAYDPITNEALCADLQCNGPSVDELGDFVGAQMAAANVGAPSITVTVTGVNGGRGDVVAADQTIRCTTGSTCTANYAMNARVTLTAVPKSVGKDRFDGWTGACAGVQLTCTVNVSEVLLATATFSLPPTVPGVSGGGGTVATSLAVKAQGGKGLIVSQPAAVDCGRTCTATVPAGSKFTLTATPEPGFVFVSWTGACTGTQASCTVTANGQTAVQANFIKP